MTDQTLQSHPQWSSRWAFVLAAAGAAVGLGNIWKFPYITGENGGGAFVLVYLLCLAVVATPVMIAEIMIGRRSRLNPIQGVARLAKESQAPRAWHGLGWIGVAAGFIILSYYAVVMGWSLSYIFRAGSGEFAGLDADGARSLFGDLVSDPERLLLWHTLAMVMTTIIVARGVRGGLELATRWLMPMLLLLLIVLMGYNIGTSGFMQAVEFMFSPDFSSLTAQSVVVAMGHAFFTLSIGMGTIMVYGSYMPAGTSIPRVTLAIVAADSIIALLAGLVIFPVVYTHGLDVSEGVGLVFMTLPIAFGQMPWGELFALLFFILLSIAAWTSSISMIEPAVSYLTDRFSFSRTAAATWVGLGAWTLGLLSVFSFNLLENWTLFGKTFFGVADFLASNLLLPLGGMLIALFAGWAMKRRFAAEELGLARPGTSQLWWVLTAIVAPAGVFFVLLNGLGVF
ncbi:MAG: sodium-dependent transporter [Halothiobacillaceae bacterium]